MSFCKDDMSPFFSNLLVLLYRMWKVHCIWVRLYCMLYIFCTQTSDGPLPKMCRDWWLITTNKEGSILSRVRPAALYLLHAPPPDPPVHLQRWVFFCAPPPLPLPAHPRTPPLTARYRSRVFVKAQVSYSRLAPFTPTPYLYTPLPSSPTPGVFAPLTHPLPLGGI